MPLYHRPVANGLRTDHPIPDLPFVDDAHLPLDDPTALEVLGRHEDADSWGREDRCPDGGWVAFTTEQSRRDLAWMVRWHPQRGRSVILYRDEDAAEAHTEFETAVLFRSGGYWWDGDTWYRPAQIWDRAREQYVRRPVPGATIVSANDLLHTGGDPRKGRVLTLGGVNLDAPRSARWLDDLAGWASRWQGERSLSECVVRLSAPELIGDELVGVTEFAQIGGIAASTLRAYIARRESDIPQSQATVGGRSVWARPVAQEWAEQRRHVSVADTVSSVHNPANAALPVGVNDIWKRFSRIFFNALWKNPDQRRRFALRWRTQAMVQALADNLGWDVAANLKNIVPVSDIGVTIRHAVLGEFASAQRDLSDKDTASAHYYLLRPVARLLDWLIRHDPDAAAGTVGDIVGEAERKLAIRPEVTVQTLRQAVSLDGKLDQATRNEFFERVLPRADEPTVR